MKNWWKFWRRGFVWKRVEAEHTGQIAPPNRADYRVVSVDGEGWLRVKLPRGAKVYRTLDETVGVSMKPVVGGGHLQVAVPVTYEQLAVGDLVYATLTNEQGQSREVFHQVIEIGSDERGWFGVTRGTNNPRPDFVETHARFLLRPGGVKTCVVAVVYETERW
ncbi:MAG: hypothetical protein EXR67_05295 [Dehalococcoidia bacterium]|nr:hypothetical protein [Dehalococcoidia bacterium]